MRPLYTVSVSKIEAYRKYLYASEDEHWLNEESLIETLKGIRTPNDKATYGSAFHAIIEHPHKNAVYASHPVMSNGDSDFREVDFLDPEWVGYNIGGIFFNLEQCRPAIEYAEAHKLMQKEIPAYKIYHLRHFDLIVTMRVDGLEGLTIRDAKTKYSTPDMREYMDSYQWRIYLDALEVDTFYYDVFQVSRYDTLADAHKAVIKPLEPLCQVRYPELSRDIHELLESFSEYIINKGFTDLIKVIPDSHVEHELNRLQITQP